MKNLRKGWVVVKVYKGKISPIVVCRDDRGIVDGITGYGELYYNKKSAQKDADDLNSNYTWNTAYFDIRKATLHWDQ